MYRSIMMLVFSALVGLPLPVWAGGRLVGQVRNQVGESVPEARLTLQGQRGTTGPTAQSLTDASGSFELTFPLTGRWQLQVDHPDYEPQLVSVWVFQDVTTPLDVTIQTPIEPLPPTRVGIIGVGQLEHTAALAQRLAGEAVRLGVVPNSERLVALDNQRLNPIIQAVGVSLSDILNAGNPNPEAVQTFFSYLGLEALVVNRVDLLTWPHSPTELKLRSRSQLELWEFDENGQLRISTLSQQNQEEVVPNDVNDAEIEQLYQIQVTRTAQAIAQSWSEANPLSERLTPDPEAEPQPRPRIDTTIELVIPR